MKGYKAFNDDLTCFNYQYDLDKTHIFEDMPVLCKKGFHFCTELKDIVKYYLSSKMRVFEIEASGIITEAEDDCSKRACSQIKLVRELSLDEVAKSINCCEYAYEWAKEIGNRDIMIDKITESEYAYLWALHVGNKDIMIDRITDSLWAYYWARDIGNQDVMINIVTDSEYAYYWAIDIGNEDIMIDKITELRWAYRWVNRFGDINQKYFIDKGIIQ